MANRYWVGGTGTWNSSSTTNWSSTSGGASGASVPTSSDDVIFDSASNATGYTVTISGSVICANLTVGNPASGVVTVGGSGSAIQTYGNFSTATGVLWTNTGEIKFESTTTGKTITTNSVVINSAISFRGIGGGWTLQDAITGGTSGSFTVLNGTFSTNNFAITWPNTISISNSSARTVTLGSSVISCKDWDASIVTNLTFTSNTASITLSGTTVPDFQGGGLTYYDLTMTGQSNTVTPGTITGANTFNNLTLIGGSNTSLAGYTISANQIVNGTLTITGQTVNQRILIASDTIGTARTITAAAVTCSNADFRDITGAGAASWNLSAITGGSGDRLGNSGITFTSSTTQHWLNTSGGSWSTAANWTSRTPLPQDDVVMDCAFTTNRTVNIDLNVAGRNITWVGATFSGTLTMAVVGSSVYGNLTLIAGMSTSSSTITFAGRSTHTITTAGVSLTMPIVVEAIGGTYTLQDNLTITNTSSSLSLNSGTLNFNNFNVTLSGSFQSSNITRVRALIMGSGTVTLSNSGTMWNCNNTSNLTITANTSTIKFTNTSSSAVTFAGGGATYYNLWFDRGSSTGSITIGLGNNIFNNFKDTGTAAHSILFTTGYSNTVASFTVSGSSGNVITINSTTTGTHSLVKTGGGTISCDYLNIQHSVATPSNTWYAGTNSTNNQAVATAGSGWSFTAAPSPKYWVGGSATWDSTAGSKWSLTSGGAGGASVPTSGEDAIFDANSGAVTISTTGMTTITCKNLVFTGFTGTFGSNASTNLEIYGDMTLVSGMTTAFTNMNFKFKGTGNLTSAGKTLPSLLFDGVGATFTLQDAMVSTQTGTVNQLTNGTLNLNNQNLTVDNFESSNSNTRTLTLGSGTITLTGTGNVWNITTATNLTLNANTSTIKITNTSSTARSFIGGGKTYNNFWNAAGASAATLTIAGSNTFADFKDDGTVAHSILFTAGTTQTVTTFTVNGTFAQLITLDSTTTGTYTLTKAGGGTITCDYLNIQHCVATPSSTWYANSHCVNNQAVVTAGSGWTFASTTDISLVAHTAASGTTSSVTTSAIDTSGATLIVVAVATDSAAGAGTLTDSKGNTWTALAAQTASANSRHQLFYCVNPTVGSGHTFTNSGATNYPSIAVAAFDRTLNTTAFDVADGNGTASPTTSLVVDSITPTFNLELIVTGFASDVATALAINSSMTIIDQLGYSAGVNMGVGLAYKVLDVAAATSPTLSWTGSKSVAASSAAFKSYLNTSGTPTSGKFFPFFRA